MYDFIKGVYVESWGTKLCDLTLFEHRVMRILKHEHCWDVFSFIYPEEVVGCLSPFNLLFTLYYIQTSHCPEYGTRV